MGRTSDAEERLIQAAIDLLWVSSYGAVSVDAICARAGVQKGSFYHFFASKDDLVIAALEAHWRSRKPILDELFSPVRPPLERLTAYFEDVYRRQTALRAKYGRVVGCFQSSIGTECVELSPAIEAKVKHILSLYVRYYESALREAQLDGSLALANPAETARALFAYMEGVLAQARIADDPAPIRGLARNARQFLGLPDKPARARGRVKSS